MNMLKRGLLGLAIVGGLGSVAGVVTAAEASAQAPQVVSSTSVLVAQSVPAPGILSQTYYNYQPQVAAPGFKLTSTTSELCLTGGPRIVCNFRVSEVGAIKATLVGNAHLTSTGQQGTITGGSGAWHGAKGVFTDANLAPHVATSTLVFTTP
jgi:hypothetical protein